jgi:hypothetical protein
LNSGYADSENTMQKLHQDYSYGDSSGIEPDSHFNPPYRREPFIGANVKSIKTKFKI